MQTCINCKQAIELFTSDNTTMEICPQCLHIYAKWYGDRRVELDPPFKTAQVDTKGLSINLDTKKRGYIQEKRWFKDVDFES